MQCVASGLALVNTSEVFFSPVFMDNGRTANPANRKPSYNQQPKSAAKTVSRLSSLEFRNRTADFGFDALGVLLVEARNDGTPWRIETRAEFGAPRPGDNMHYTRMVQRISHDYGGRFAHL